MNSQIFNIYRFGLTIKRDLMLNRRQLTLNGLMMLGLLTLLMIFIATFMANELDNNITKMRHAMKTLEEVYTVIFYAGGLGFCVLGASTFATNLSSTGKRLLELMSPSSHAEKFLSRFIICILCVPIAFAVSFAIAQLIALLTVKIIYGYDYNYITPLYHTILVPSVIWVILCSVMTYMLGSTLWPKRSFVKTFVAVMIAQTLGSILLMIFFNLFGIRNPFSDEQWHNLYVSFIISWSVCCLVLSYLRLKHIEIIKRKRLW